jgi:opacity protein-like surface antigen
MTMRRTFLWTAAVCGMLLFSTRADAQTRGGQFQGFGGLTFGTTATATTFGGGIAVPLGDHVQIVGEFGRMDDLKSTLLDTFLDLTPADVRLSAWYGEGGIRFAGSRHSAIRPYVEATVGAARLTPALHDVGDWGPLANTALVFLASRTEPMVGGGAGVMLQSGPLVVDAGYRYKRVLSTNGLASAFTLGNGVDVNQFRVGVGIAF